MERLTITSGAHAGQRLKLKSWQRQAIEQIYAENANSRRPVRTALLSMGRKAGKSTFAAALSLAHLAGPEARQRGQVIAAAADRNQAGVIFAEMEAFAAADPDLAGRISFKQWNKSAIDTVTGSTFTTASSDAKKQHGTSPVFCIADEMAQWRGRDLYDALTTGQGAWVDPLCIVASTRSPDPDSPLEELIAYGQKI
jgi:phage terminase large subunit-like protein